MATPKKFGFEVVRDYKTRQNRARATCSCGAYGHVTFKGRLPPPDFLDKKMVEAGWERVNGNRWRCPDCIAARAAKRAGDKPSVKLAPMAPPPKRREPHPEILAAIRLQPRPIHRIDVYGLALALEEFSKGVNSREAATPFNISDSTLTRWARALSITKGGGIPGDLTMNIAQQKPRPLTPLETRKAFNLLDKLFDDVAGRYATGWSDERVAAEIDVPRASLTAARDEAYGKLKSNPEVDKLLELVERLQKESDQIDKQIATLTGEQSRLRKGIDEATTKALALSV